VVWKLAQPAYGFLLIVGMMATVALCFYIIWWMVMIVMTFIPIIGKRHRHAGGTRSTRCDRLSVDQKDGTS